MKTVVGRAREASGIAEAELMSSTSHNVCELWDGQGIVRVLGAEEAQIVELAYAVTRNPNTFQGEHRLEVVPISTAVNKGWYHAEGDISKRTRLASIFRNKVEQHLPSGVSESLRSTYGFCQGVKNYLWPTRPALEPRNRTEPPNLSLSVEGALTPKWELVVFAFLGCIIQSGVFIYNILLVKHPSLKHLTNDGGATPGYAMPTTLIGMGLVMVGLLLCAHVSYSQHSICGTRLTLLGLNDTDENLILYIDH